MFFYFHGKLFFEFESHKCLIKTILKIHDTGVFLLVKKNTHFNKWNLTLFALTK